MKLTVDQIIEYQTKGFLIAEDVLTDDDLQPVVDELSAMVDERARALHADGKLAELHESEPFERRYALLHRQCPEIGQDFDIMHLRGKAMFGFLANENLLNVVECLLGRELTCNPIQHIRAKLPNPIPGDTTTAEDVPWHQDAAVTLEEANDSEIVTFWLPLVDATAETGCMELMPEVFKMGYLEHYVDGGTTIVPAKLPHVRPVVAECRKGSIVIMNKFTPHRGLTNRANIARWSIDLRYHKTGAASGRPFHPSFVVRSTANPAAVLDDHEQWSSMWETALRAGSQRDHRV